MKRFCAKCGKEFEATSAAVRYCDDCKAEVKKEWQEKQKQYAKARATKLGLVNITVYKESRDAIKAMAIEGKTVADVVKELLEGKQEVKEVKQESKKIDLTKADTKKEKKVAKK